MCANNLMRTNSKYHFFLKKAIRLLKKNFFQYEKIILYRLGNPKYITANCVIKTVNHLNVEDVLYFQPCKYVEIFKNFLLENDKGYYAYINGKCIHRSWVQYGLKTIYLHSQFAYELKENDVFIHYCETAQEARGKNIYSYVLSKIISDNIGKNILIAVSQNNIPSRKGVEKVGFKEYCVVRVIVLLGFKFIKENINFRD